MTQWSPKTRDRLCSHCCCVIEGPAIPLAHHYQGTCDDLMFHVSRAVFCSWNCMLAVGGCKGIVFLTLYRACVGRYPLHVHTAPPRRALQEFGGDLTYAEFHRGRDTTMHTCPQVSYLGDRYRDGVWVLGRALEGNRPKRTRKWGYKGAKGGDVAPAKPKTSVTAELGMVKDPSDDASGPSPDGPPPPTPTPIVDQIRVKRNRKKKPRTEAAAPTPSTDGGPRRGKGAEDSQFHNILDLLNR